MSIPGFINDLIFIFMIIFNLKQVFYLIVALLKKEKHSNKKAYFHHYAVMICARNEAAVIADLLDSIKSQLYPQDLIDVFVMADNCSDNTADIASSRGVHVYTRFNSEKIGKGYALEALMDHIREDYPEGFDGYFVFDADNILENNYIEQMNRKFSDGHEIVTGYRNSKNFADNWVSAGNSLWFLWDSKYLNYPRLGLAVIILSGFAGCIFDSFLGAFFQALYIDADSGKYTEKKKSPSGKDNALVSGIKWMDNDMVNLTSNTLSAVTAFIVAMII